MPIVTKTGSCANQSGSNIYGYIVADSFSAAVANAIGTEVKKINNSEYYVTMDPIGYPGWCVYFFGGANNTRFDIRIMTTKDDGSPNFDDPYRSTFAWTNFDIVNKFGYYRTSSCVMIYDENKDTVLFDVHPGETTHGTNIDLDMLIHSTFFFAKDVNDDVLCGLGWDSMALLRTTDTYYNEPAASWNYAFQKAPAFGGSLHLTKMINYLSPGCPEMKSAYVSVVRPDEDSTQERLVKLYEVNGVKYGRVGRVNSWFNKPSGWNKYVPMLQFDPIVKY